MKESEKILLAGPWIGEFGWELMQWQGRLRKLSEQYEIIVACQSGHEYLYKDFAKNIITFDLRGGQPEMWKRRGVDFSSKDFWLNAKVGKNASVLAPCNMAEKEQKFIRFGNKLKTRPYDIIIHARSTNNLKTDYRNWSVDNWKKVVNWFNKRYTIASIGTFTGAHWIEGTHDERSISLNILVDYIHNALITLGPSSGPMHLASLCGCPHLVWTAKNAIGVIQNKLRYEKLWNPLNTFVEVIEGNSWRPDSSTVITIAENMLKEYKR